MLLLVTSIALDISLGVAWWITKQVTYRTIAYMVS